jgi:hypothetical protein
MYGMVNKALKGLVINNYDEDTWVQICDKANFYDYDFAGLKSYPDSLTYNLVAAASKVLTTDSSILLEMFGEYWITFTAEEGYGNLIKMSGKSFPEFISNLNHLHCRLENIMPNLKPPIFKSKSIGNNRIELVYQSERDGFYPMLLGLIKGLGKRFNHEVIIDRKCSSKINSINEIILHVTWK